jgi:hypothetical protein
MAERLNVPPWKGGIGVTLSGVRIPSLRTERSEQGERVKRGTLYVGIRSPIERLWERSELKYPIGVLNIVMFESPSLRTVVFLSEKPLWMMVYYGLVHDGANKDVYGFLIESLSSTTVDMPYRGPALFEKGVWKYENKLVGEVERFSGTEKIFRNGQCVYEASYIGGLVDQ